MAYWFVVPGGVSPHGYGRCWLPPAAAYSHSASLGRKPPSQMQNAYDSHQLTQLIGRFSLAPAEAVHVWSMAASASAQARLAFVGATLLSSAASHPGS